MRLRDTPRGETKKRQESERLTNLWRLAAGKLGEELRVLVGFVACPGAVGAQRILEGVGCIQVWSD